MARSSFVAAALLMAALLSQVAAYSDNSMSQSIERRYIPTANSTWNILRNNGSGFCLTTNQYVPTPGGQLNHWTCLAYQPWPQGYAPETHKNSYLWGFTNSSVASWLVFNLGGGLCATATSSPLSEAHVRGYANAYKRLTLQPCDCASKLQLFKPSKTGQLVLDYHPRQVGANSTCHAQTYKNVTANAYQEAEDELDYDDELEKPVKSKIYLCLAAENYLESGGVLVEACNATNPLQVWKFEPFIHKKAVIAE